MKRSALPLALSSSGSSAMTFVPSGPVGLSAVRRALAPSSLPSVARPSSLTDHSASFAGRQVSSAVAGSSSGPKALGIL